METLEHESVIGVGKRQVDRFVGRSIAEARTAIGFSEADLASQVGIPLEVLVGVENGDFRIKADRLLTIASVLGVTVGRFYGACPAVPPQDHDPHLHAFSYQAVSALPDPICRAVMLLVTGRDSLPPPAAGRHVEGDAR